MAEHADNPLGYKFSWNPGAAIKASRNISTFMKNGKKVVAPPLKLTEQQDDFSVSMKLETYPNRDSTVFMERFGMKDCHTFIRGTIRFSGFSAIIAAFHDIGITSDDIVPPHINTLRQLLDSKLQKVYGINDSTIEKCTFGMSDFDKDLIRKIQGKIDLSYLPGMQRPKVIQDIVKTLKFLGFFEEGTIDMTNKSYLDVLSGVMAKRLALKEHDRDLVIMRHIFRIRDPKKKEEWQHTSTMVASGNSKASGKHSIMA